MLFTNTNQENDKMEGEKSQEKRKCIWNNSQEVKTIGDRQEKLYVFCG